MMQNSAYQTPAHQTAPRFTPLDTQQSVRRGVVYLVIATILGWTPWFSGPSWPWSLLLMSLALLIGAEPWTKHHERGSIILTLLCVAITWQVLHLGLGVVPWLLASFFLISAQSFRLDFSRWRVGYATYIPIGIALCLLSLLTTWHLSNGVWSFGWRGGMETIITNSPTAGFWSAENINNSALHASNTFFPGFAFSGRTVSGALWVEIALLGIAAWSLWRDNVARAHWRLAPMVAIAALEFWALPAIFAGYAGPLWFMLGLAICGFGVWKSALGQTHGTYDPADVWQRTRAKLKI